MKMKWKSLPHRLLIIVCATFLPLNIMAILVCGIVLSNTFSQRNEAYQHELDVAMDLFETDLNWGGSLTDDFAGEYQLELTLADDNDIMTDYGMLSFLEKLYTHTRLKGHFYLYDKMNDRFFVKCSGAPYTPVEIEQLKKNLRKEDLPSGANGRWQIAGNGETACIMRYYEYTNYKLFYAVDIAATLDQMLSEELLTMGDVYFTDGETCLVRGEDGACEYAGDADWETLAGKEFFHSKLLAGSEELGYQICIAVNNTYYLQSIPPVYWILFVISLLCLLLLSFLWKVLRRRVVIPLGKLKRAMEQLQKENLEFRIAKPDPSETIEFQYMYAAFNEMADEIKASYEKDIKMYQAELDNLKLQVNPHMLLNSFNMIYSLAQVKNYECIQEFSLCLVNYFRYVLKETDTFVTVEKEMEFVKNYIDIQKIRFPGAFSSVSNVEEETLSALVPPLLIQNFVENAMKYALIPGKVVEVLINIRREDSRLLISVCDTGRGIKPEILEHLLEGEVYTDRMGKKHIGVWNCRRRMEVFYGKDTKLHLTSKFGEGTQVWMELPFLTEAKEENDR